jgi:hypothetical protein
MILCHNIVINSQTTKPFTSTIMGENITTSPQTISNITNESEEIYEIDTDEEEEEEEDKEGYEEDKEGYEDDEEEDKNEKAQVNVATMQIGFISMLCVVFVFIILLIIISIYCCVKRHNKTRVRQGIIYTHTT